MSERPARPWDLFSKNIGRVTDATKEERMAICRECEFFVSLTQQCAKCLCIMPAKTNLPNAFCPEHKWGAVSLSNVSFTEEVAE